MVASRSAGTSERSLVVSSSSWLARDKDSVLGLSHSRQLHPCQLTSEARLAHVFEHLAHLCILPQKLVYFLHAGAGAAGDSFAPAAVDQLVVIALFRRHGVNNGFHAVELSFIHVVRRLLHV